MKWKEKCKIEYIKQRELMCAEPKGAIYLFSIKFLKHFEHSVVSQSVSQIVYIDEHTVFTLALARSAIKLISRGTKYNLEITKKKKMVSDSIVYFLGIWNENSKWIYWIGSVSVNFFRSFNSRIDTIPIYNNTQLQQFTNAIVFFSTCDLALIRK